VAVPLPYAIAKPQALQHFARGRQAATLGAMPTSDALQHLTCRAARSSTPDPFRTFMLVLVNDDCERGVINTARSTNDRCVP